MSRAFKYFIISTNDIYWCISWIIKCLNVTDTRCKYEECMHFIVYPLQRKNVIIHYLVFKKLR